MFKNFLNKSDVEGFHFLRWMLFLVNAADSAGIEVLTRQHLHSMLFLSFASSSFYGIKPLRQRAQKTIQGPYYRAAHISLGMLSVSGLIDIKDFRSYPSIKDLQFDAVFRPTVSGLNVADDLRLTSTGGRLYKFLLDLCLATVAAIPEISIEDYDGGDLLGKTLKKDLTYQMALRGSGRTLDAEQDLAEGTPTVVGLKAIEKSLMERGGFNYRDVLTAYQGLMKKRVS